MKIVKISNNFSFCGVFCDFRKWFEKSDEFCRKHNYFSTCVGNFSNRNDKHCRRCNEFKKSIFIGSYSIFDYIFVLRERDHLIMSCDCCFKVPFVAMNKNNIIVGFYGSHVEIPSNALTEEKLSDEERRILLSNINFNKNKRNKEFFADFSIIGYESSFTDSSVDNKRTFFSFKLSEYVPHMKLIETRKIIEKTYPVRGYLSLELLRVFI